MPAPLPSIHLSNRNINCEERTYRSAVPTQPDAPQLKTIYLKNRAADACCSTGVAWTTLVLSLFLFAMFIVVANQLGRNDNFCDGYVGPIHFVPARLNVRLTLPSPPCAYGQWKYDDKYQLSGEVRAAP